MWFLSPVRIYILALKLVRYSFWLKMLKFFLKFCLPRLSVIPFVSGASPPVFEVISSKHCSTVSSFTIMMQKFNLHWNIFTIYARTNMHNYFLVFYILLPIQLKALILILSVSYLVRQKKSGFFSNFRWKYWLKYIMANFN